jgi:hypothetical protein
MFFRVASPAFRRLSLRPPLFRLPLSHCGGSQSAHHCHYTRTTIASPFILKNVAGLLRDQLFVEINARSA